MKNYSKRFHFFNKLIVLSFWAFCQATSLALWGDLSSINYENVILQYELTDFSNQQYSQAVKKLFQTYETVFLKKLTPGEKRNVGLKVYTASGPGLSTPHALVLSVIKELETRGFAKNEIFIIDEYAYNLRLSAFLPPLSEGGNTFAGVRVYSLDQKIHWDPQWHYISSLSSKHTFSRKFPFQDDQDKSFLPVPLLLDVDFWINLPMITSHESTAVSGALTNATIFNISNNKRFIDNPVHASIAIAEIAAIPELQESWVFTLMALERYQFVGGFIFNLRYTGSERLLWLSTNAPAMDYLAFQRINKCRQQEQLPVFKVPPSFFEYCKTLDVGNYTDTKILKIK